MNNSNTTIYLALGLRWGSPKTGGEIIMDILDLRGEHFTMVEAVKQWGGSIYASYEDTNAELIVTFAINTDEHKTYCRFRREMVNAGQEEFMDMVRANVARIKFGMAVSSITEFPDFD